MTISPDYPIHNYRLPRDSLVLFRHETMSKLSSVEAEGPFDVKLLDMESGHEETVSKRRVYELGMAGHVQIWDRQNYSKALQQHNLQQSQDAFNQLSESDRRAVLIKQEVMRRFERVVALEGKLTNKTVKEASQELRLLYPDMRGSGRSTLWDDWGEWERSGGNIMSLVRRRSAGNSDDRFPEEIINLFIDVINEFYKRMPPPDASVVYLIFEKKIQDINAVRESAHHYKIPKLRTFRRWIKTKFDQYELAEARHGKEYARKHFGGVGRGERATRPLEIVQADHTPIDLGLISGPLALPCGRAWLTTLIDVYTRCIIGFHVSFDPPSYVSIARALENAIKDKAYVQKDYPNVRNIWPCFGKPEQLVLDNAPEFHSDDFEVNCGALGIRLVFVEKKTPHLKGIVERVQWTINRFLQNMPASTYSNALKRGDFDPDKHVSVTLAKLIEALHRYVIDVYHQRPHRGISAIPYERWMAGVAQWPPRLVDNLATLRVILGQRAKAKLHDYGIDFKNVRFGDATAIRQIRSHPKFNSKVPVEFYYNADDASRIHVQTPDGDHIEFQAQDFDEIKGMSFFQFNYLRKQAIQAMNGRVNWDAINKAQLETMELLGFFGKKRRRRLNRTETRIASQIERQMGVRGGDLESIATASASESDPVAAPSSPLAHRENLAGYGSSVRIRPVRE